METTFTVISVDQQAGLLVVKYSRGDKEVTLNIGYPVDDSDLESYIQSRVPTADLADRTVTRTAADVLTLTGIIAPSDDAQPFTLVSL
jgi:hypothetical protein